MGMLGLNSLRNEIERSTDLQAAKMIQQATYPDGTDGKLEGAVPSGTQL
jgi:hypothetical protein